MNLLLLCRYAPLLSYSHNLRIHVLAIIKKAKEVKEQEEEQEQDLLIIWSSASPSFQASTH